MSREKARLYTRQNGKFLCGVCPHHCLLDEDQEGICGVRKVQDGELLLKNYGACVAEAVDPVEKKPLYHFYPGSDVLSLGTWGCNFKCPYCQNWPISQEERERQAQRRKPEEVLQVLKQAGSSCTGVAFTYNEPSIWFEFVYDTSRLVKRHGYKNVLVTNGFLSFDALSGLFPYIDALNVDVKAFSEEFYTRYCRGRLAPVMQTVEKSAGELHVEVTYLVIPEHNDSRGEIKGMVDWLSGISPDIPLHFSRYHPDYTFSQPPTPVPDLEEAREQALQKLNYVYLGNVPGHPGAHTYCPECRTLLIERGGFRAVIRGLEGGKCTYCGAELRIYT